MTIYDGLIEMREAGMNLTSFVFVNMMSDTSILHHAFMIIFIALWAVISHYGTILMLSLSYFTRYT